MLDIKLKDIENIALKASEVVMQIYNKDFSVEYKDDNSPLTQADIQANKIICDTLKELYPSIPIMSEENKEVSYDVRKNWSYYWCIDPIDGTKEFVKKNGEFTINIALIEKDTPVLGVVYAPVLKDMYSAKKGFGAFKNGKQIKNTTSKNTTIKVVASKSHLNDETKNFIEKLGNVEIVSCGSSLKLCMVAEGKADIYPRLSPTMEWDTAAADAVVRESGKMTYNYETDKPMVYNKENLLNSWFVVR